MNSIDFINPSTDDPSSDGGDLRAATGLAPAPTETDLTPTTLAAMVPPDFRVRIWDESISPVDLDTDARFIAITGRVTQAARMIQLALEFLRRGKVVLMGGPFASLSPDVLRPYCHILVRGEMAAIADTLFDDLRTSRWKRDYDARHPNRMRSAVPR